MTHSHVDRKKNYDPHRDLAPYVKFLSKWSDKKLLPLPNLSLLLSPEKALNRAAHSPNPNLHCYMLIPDDPVGASAWGTLFLNTLQSGSWDGTGLLVIPNYTSNSIPVARNFQLCPHQVKLSPSAKPERGLHDQFCTLCGLDMSYDSSD